MSPNTIKKELSPQALDNVHKLAAKFGAKYQAQLAEKKQKEQKGA